MKKFSIVKLTIILIVALILGVILMALIWLTVPGHQPGEIIISEENIQRPIIKQEVNEIKQTGYRASLFDTTWPADMANLNRSNSVVNAGLPRNVTPDMIRVESVEMPYPVFSYTRNEDEVFVVGGTSFLLDQYVDNIDGLGNLGFLNRKSEPHITKYNPFTGEQVRLKLDRGEGLDYIGGGLIHANGYVYVVFQSHLYKINPDSMSIERSVDLPLATGLQARFTIYNGLSTSSTGELITKYWSLLGDDSKFFLIDPETLEITDDVEYPGGSPRLTVAPDRKGNEYLYHLNKQVTYRMLVKQSSLVLDTNWQSRYDPYFTGQNANEEPTSPVIANGHVHYTTNTFFKAEDPMRIFWQDINTNYSLDNSPLPGTDLFQNIEDGGWSFFHLSVDEDSGIIIGNDQGNGLINAIRISEDNQIEHLWQVNIRTSARPVIVLDREMVYVTDFVNGINNLVILDLTTGEELFRIPTPAKRATISTIIVSTANEVYFGSNEPGEEIGLFHRIYVPNGM